MVYRMFFLWPIFHTHFSTFYGVKKPNHFFQKPRFFEPWKRVKKNG